MLRVGFEPTISAGEWPQTYALDRAATGTGCERIIRIKYDVCVLSCRSYPPRKPHLLCAALYCHLWPAPLYRIIQIIS